MACPLGECTSSSPLLVYSEGLGLCVFALTVQPQLYTANQLVAKNWQNLWVDNSYVFIQSHRSYLILCSFTISKILVNRSALPRCAVEQDPKPSELQMSLMGLGLWKCWDCGLKIPILPGNVCLPWLPFAPALIPRCGRTSTAADQPSCFMLVLVLFATKHHQQVQLQMSQPKLPWNLMHHCINDKILKPYLSSAGRIILQHMQKFSGPTTLG